MKNKITDINDLVSFLITIAARSIMNDEVWKCYGYKRRPRHGKIWDKISPKMFKLEKFIFSEIATMALIDILNGIKKSAETPDIKLLLFAGVIDQFLSTNVFSPELFMENLFSTYVSYLKSKKTELHVPILSKAKDVLEKKDFAKFSIGTIFLLLGATDDFLIKSDNIKDLIEKSSKENSLKISMSDKMYRKYLPLLEEKILNA